MKTFFMVLACIAGTYVTVYVIIKKRTKKKTFEDIKTYDAHPNVAHGVKAVESNRVML